MRSFAILFLLSFLFAAVAETASAASVQVSPIKLELQTPRLRGEVALTNVGDDNTRFQVRAILPERDKNGEFRYTKDVIVAPPVVSLRKGQTAVVRVGVRPRNRAALEKGYGLVFTQIGAVERAADDSAGQVAGISAKLKFVVPVTIKAAQ